MRVAVISDIHGNQVALDAVLGDLQAHPADQIVCLGDAIQGGPQPAQVVTRLRELACPVVMGNADAWLLSGKETGAESRTAERQQILDAVRDWSLSQLSAEDRSFIQGFRSTVEIPLEAGRKLLCFHGSPDSFDDILLPDSPQETFVKVLGGHKADVLCGGHTHVQYVRRIAQDGRIMFNPGSVGLAYAHHQPEGNERMDAWAEYAVLRSDGEALALEFRRVPYDVGPLLEAYRHSGRPYAGKAIEQYGRP
jgi:predicted phosphodiesterase